ncbi:MAG TPA: 30S ribosomal protein S4 [Myxococcales bacterium LLY-WYZ-16_1]|jgi:small subunit ribosomal protein S4|nr:30S ribosomal protein S4 [Myxococcales bacterium LLY-WYZ-16_1]
MSRYTGPRLRIARRLGGAELPGLFVPRELRRPYPPGQHGPTQRIKLSDYAIRLREKQKLRAHYGVSEKQFRRYMVRSKRKKGNTGENLLSMLESRLDNVVFRLGFARTIRAARQLVGHGHVEVNGRKTDVPSFLVNVGDVVQIREASKMRERIAAEMAGPSHMALPPYVERDDKFLRGTIKARPELADCPLTINESLVVELYALSL